MKQADRCLRVLHAEPTEDSGHAWSSREEAALLLTPRNARAYPFAYPRGSSVIGARGNGDTNAKVGTTVAPVDGAAFPVDGAADEIVVHPKGEIAVNRNASSASARLELLAPRLAWMLPQSEKSYQQLQYRKKRGAPISGGCACISRPMFVALWTRLLLPWVLVVVAMLLLHAAKWPWIVWAWRVGIKGTSRAEADRLWESVVFAGDRDAGAAERTLLGPQLELLCVALQVALVTGLTWAMTEAHASDPGIVPPAVTRRAVALALLAEAPAPGLRMARLRSQGARGSEEGPWQEAGAVPLGPLGEGELLGAAVARLGRAGRAGHAGSHGRGTGGAAPPPRRRAQGDPGQSAAEAAGPARSLQLEVARESVRAGMQPWDPRWLEVKKWGRRIGTVRVCGYSDPVAWSHPAVRCTHAGAQPGKGAAAGAGLAAAEARAAALQQAPVPLGVRARLGEEGEDERAHLGGADADERPVSTAAVASSSDPLHPLEPHLDGQVAGSCVPGHKGAKAFVGGRGTVQPIKSDSAHYCEHSGRVISGMDHFCPWLGANIGEGNRRVFLVLLSLAACSMAVLVLQSASIAAGAVTGLRQAVAAGPWLIAAATCAGLGMGVGSFAVHHWLLACRGLTTVEYVEKRVAGTQWSRAAAWEMRPGQLREGDDNALGNKEEDEDEVPPAAAAEAGKGTGGTGVRGSPSLRLEREDCDLRLASRAATGTGTARAMALLQRQRTSEEDAKNAFRSVPMRLARQAWAEVQPALAPAASLSGGTGASSGPAGSGGTEGEDGDDPAAPGACDGVLRASTCGACGSSDAYLGEGPWAGGRDASALLAPGPAAYGEPDSQGAGMVVRAGAGVGAEEEEEEEESGSAESGDGGGLGHQMRMSWVQVGPGAYGGGCLAWVLVLCPLRCLRSHAWARAGSSPAPASRRAREFRAAQLLHRFPAHWLHVCERDPLQVPLHRDRASLVAAAELRTDTWIRSYDRRMGAAGGKPVPTPRAGPAIDSAKSSQDEAAAKASQEAAAGSGSGSVGASRGGRGEAGLALG